MNAHLLDSMRNFPFPIYTALIYIGIYMFTKESIKTSNRLVCTWDKVQFSCERKAIGKGPVWYQ